MLRAASALALVLVVAGPWLALPARWRRPGAVVIWRALLIGFGVRVRVRGAPAPASGTLFVANHISWTDIPVLGLLLDAPFVAKSEVRGWPVIGALAARYGCVFVERDRRCGARAMAGAVEGRIGKGMVLFPEGTTGLGDGVLPFRSSLFAAGEGARVQPVSLRYRRRDGADFTPEQQRRNAWMGEDALLPHAFGLAAEGGVVAEVWFEEVLPPAPRKALAQAAQGAIARRIAGD